MSSYDNFYDEIYSSAIWAKNLYKQNKNYRISIVLQNLNTHIQKIERIFSDVFLSEGDCKKDMFNISSGLSLGKTQLVSDAMTIINTLYKSLSINDYINLFKSPYIEQGKSFILFVLSERTDDDGRR